MLRIAIASEYALAEKLVQTLELHGFAEKIEHLSAVTFSEFGEEEDLRFNKKAVAEIPVGEVIWSDFDYVFFAGQLEQASYIVQAANAGCIVIDMLGLCANLPDVALVVPSVNNEDIEQIRTRNIVSLPDAQVTQVALSLAKLVQNSMLNQVMISSILPASYQNSHGVAELAGQTARLLNGMPLEEDQKRLAFDVFPQVKANLASQLQRLFPNLNDITFHQIQAPVFYGLAQMVTLNSSFETELNPFDEWKSQQFLDVQLENTLTPVGLGASENEEQNAQLHISNISLENNRLSYWSVADDQRFDIALMAVELAEIISTSY